MNNSLQAQVGGKHYKGMVIQPIELSMANGYDACIHSAIKYMSRHRDKGGADDLRKAAHFLELRIDTCITLGMKLPVANGSIPILRYVEANQIPSVDAAIIVNIHQWATTNSEDIAHSNLTPRAKVAFIKRQIDGLIEQVYGETL
jgi:hypothetical protein